MEFALRAESLKRWLMRFWFVLVVAGLLVEWWKYVVLGPRGELVYFLGLSYEKNLPTWYVSSLLLTCSFLLALIALATWKKRAPYVWAWGMLSAGFAYISLDEATTIHENWSKYFDYDGVLYFGWVIPAGILVATLGLILARFLVALPRETRWKFLASGAIYVGGAVGVELLLGYWTDIAGRKNLIYGLIDWVEESMELLGVTLFCVALVEYIRDHVGAIRVSIHPPEPTVARQQQSPIAQPVELIDAQPSDTVAEETVAEETVAEETVAEEEEEKVLAAT